MGPTRHREGTAIEVGRTRLSFRRSLSLDPDIEIGTTDIGGISMGAPNRALSQALAANRWKPGQSGNPSGHSGEYGQAVRLARQAAPYAVHRLIVLMDSDDERVAAVACNSIL